MFWATLVMCKMLLTTSVVVLLAGISSSAEANDLDQYYEVALRATKEAGEIIRQRIWGRKNVQTKSSTIDFVTETDQQVEKMIKSNISLSFPEHKFIGEESTAAGARVELTDSPTWIIDPIDGTMNFVHGYPVVSISVALLVDKVTELAVVYNPVLDQLFTARRGRGAFLNDRPIHVSDTKNLSDALLGHEFGTSQLEHRRVNIENMKTLIPLVQGMRSGGSAALNMAHVALGGLDAYFEFNIHAWDIAAGDLLVREAGGVVLDPAGGAFDLMSRRVLCASTKELAESISGRIEQAYPPRDA